MRSSLINPNPQLTAYHDKQIKSPSYRVKYLNLKFILKCAVGFYAFNKENLPANFEIIGYFLIFYLFQLLLGI